jgi:prepilin-type N-terminal cleavage/methylation domain-containing protein
VKPALREHTKSQAGYTLVELIVASAIGLMVMSGLTSVVLTTWRAGMTATNRIEASGQIRNFEFFAYDDFARSGPPVVSGCRSDLMPPCTIRLSGSQVSNPTTLVTADYNVTYTWDGANVLRQVVGSNTTKVVATNVKTFSASIDGTNQTVVVTMTVVEQDYEETQMLRFYPRVNP